MSECKVLNVLVSTCQVCVEDCEEAKYEVLKLLAEAKEVNDVCNVRSASVVFGEVTRCPFCSNDVLTKTRRSQRLLAEFYEGWEEVTFWIRRWGNEVLHRG